MNQSTLRLYLLLVLFALTSMTKTNAQEMETAVRLLDGTKVVGTGLEISESGEWSFSSLPEKRLLSEIIAIEFVSSADIPPATHTVPFIQFVDGSRIMARNPTIDSEILHFESVLNLPNLPLQHVRAIVWKSTKGVEEKIVNASTSKDCVLVDTPDGERTFEGLVEALDKQQLQLQYQNESRKIGISRINGIIMANIGGQADAQGPLATIQLRDGSILKGNIERLRQEVLLLALGGGLSLEIQTSSVQSVSIRSDRQEYLSNLDPIDVYQKSDFSIQRSWRKDTNVLGTALTLRTDNPKQVAMYQKGIGTQAFTQLDFANEKDFTRLRAVVGIDVSTQGRGDCQMVVRGDGAELWSSRIKGPDSGREIEVDIQGIKVVSLIVHPGEAFDLSDHANWCNVRFEK